VTSQIKEENVFWPTLFEELFQLLGDDISRFVREKFNRELTNFGIPKNFGESSCVYDWDSQMLVTLVHELVACN
jgi:hypothetical protein